MPANDNARPIKPSVRNLAAPSLKPRRGAGRPPAPVLFIPRPWQSAAISKLYGKTCTEINAPTGSGKGPTMSLLAQRSIQDGYKALIVVPTREISAGFQQPWRFRIGRQTVDWLPQVLEEEGRKRQLRRFLRQTTPGAVVATHACLASLDVALQKNPDLIHGLHLFVDEAHHVQHDGKGERNHLGQIVRLTTQEALRDKARITLATATRFRGDRLDIIPKEAEPHFESYVRHVEDHLEEVRIKKVRYHLVTYPAAKPRNVTDYPRALSSVYRLLGKARRGMVYMPHTSRSTNVGKGKSLQLKRVLKHLSDRRVGNLVGDTQKEVQDKIFEARSRNEDLSYDIIVAMNLGREGFDWPAADHIVMLDPAESLTQNVQQFGRVLRGYRHPKTGRVKSEVDVVLVAPRAPAGSPHERAVFERYMKAVHLALLGERVYDTHAPRDGRPLDEQASEMAGVERRALERVRGSGKKGRALERAVKAAVMEEQELIWAKRARTPTRGGKETGADKAGGDSKRAGKIRQGTDMVLRAIKLAAAFHSDSLEVEVVDVSRTGYHAATVITPARLRWLREIVVRKRLTWDAFVEVGKPQEMVPKFGPEDQVPLSQEKSEWIHKGHSVWMTYSAVYSGQGCGVCRGLQGQSHEKNRLAVEKHGKLLYSLGDSDPLPKDDDKVLFICVAQGHKTEKNFHTAKIGQGCGFCAKRQGQSHEKNRLAVEKHGWLLYLLDDGDPLPKSTDRLLFSCVAQGHKTEKAFDDAKSGRGCRLCLGNKISSIARAKGKPLTNSAEQVFGSLIEAAEMTKVSNIHAALNGRIKTAGGLVWRYLTKKEAAAWNAAGRPERMDFGKKAS